jgi:hypothetical protein
MFIYVPGIICLPCLGVVTRSSGTIASELLKPLFGAALTMGGMFTYENLWLCEIVYVSVGVVSGVISKLCI